LLLVGTARAQPSPDRTPPAGAPPELAAYGCRAEGANRSCLECTPDSTGGTFCARCTRQPDGLPLSCLLPTAADLGVLTAAGVTPSRNINTTWRPRPAFQTFACTPEHGCLECEADGRGGTFCERCKRDPSDQLVDACSLGDDDRKELASHGITPAASRAATAWSPWHPAKPAVPPPSLAAGSIPGITEYHCEYLATYNERVCQECKADNTCERVLRDVNQQPKNTWPLAPSEIAWLTRYGVAISNLPATPAQPPPPVVVPAPAVPLHAPEPEPEPERERHRPRGVSFGIEVGHVSPDDGQNIYGPGYGRGWVLGYSIVEVRLETYDLPDRSKTYDNVGGANGRFSVYSFAARPTLKTVGPLELTVLVGLAALSRPSLAMDPNDLISESQLRDQYGAGVLAGVGVRLFDVLTVDLRGYLVSWQGNSGQVRAELGANDALTYATIGDPPGGMPITLNVGAGWAF